MHNTTRSWAIEKNLSHGLDGTGGGKSDWASARNNGGLGQWGREWSSASAGHEVVCCRLVWARGYCVKLLLNYLYNTFGKFSSDMPELWCLGTSITICNVVDRKKNCYPLWCCLWLPPYWSNTQILDRSHPASSKASCLDELWAQWKGRVAQRHATPVPLAADKDGASRRSSRRWHPYKFIRIQPY